MTAKKSFDVTQSEFFPEEGQVYPLEDLHGLTDNDLVSVISTGILTRPLIRDQVREVLKTRTVKDEKTEVVKLEYVYDNSVIVSALSAAIKKVLLLECAKSIDSAIHFTTYRGRVCLTKEPTNEADKPFTMSDEKHICISGILNESRMKFLMFSVNNGKITKDDVSTLDGVRLAVMVIESVGLSVFRQMIVNESNLSSNLSDRMKAFIADFNPSEPRPIVLVMNELKADAAKEELRLKNEKEGIAGDEKDYERMPKADYLADIKELAIHIKNEAKAQDIVTSTRSRMLIPNICFALMERFKRVENLND